MTINAHGLVDYSPDYSGADEPGSALSEGRSLFFFFSIFFFNDLNENIFTT